ncbi:hypothetical protein LEMLEM_LOCUS18628 [Lemmus lemmus]
MCQPAHPQGNLICIWQPSGSSSGTRSGSTKTVSPPPSSRCSGIKVYLQFIFEQIKKAHMLSINAVAWLPRRTRVTEATSLCFFFPCLKRRRHVFNDVSVLPPSLQGCHYTKAALRNSFALNSLVLLNFSKGEGPEDLVPVYLRVASRRDSGISGPDMLWTACVTDQILKVETSDVNKPLLLLPTLFADIILALKSRQDLPETVSLWRSGKLDELKSALCPLKVVQPPTPLTCSAAAAQLAAGSGGLERSGGAF